MGKARKGARRESSFRGSFLDHQRAKQEVDKSMRDLDLMVSVVSKVAPIAESRMKARARAAYPQFGDDL